MHCVRQLLIHFLYIDDLYIYIYIYVYIPIGSRFERVIEGSLEPYMVIPKPGLWLYVKTSDKFLDGMKGLHQNNNNNNKNNNNNIYIYIIITFRSSLKDIFILQKRAIII